MMGMMMGFMLFGALFCVVVLAGAIWLLAHWLNKRQEPPTLYTPYQRDEQEYQPRQPLSENYQERRRHDRYPHPKQEYDQPYVAYPQDHEMPPQS